MADGVSRSLWRGDTRRELRMQISTLQNLHVQFESINALAVEEFACFQISKGVDRFKLHVQVLKCGSNDVKKLQGLN